VGAVIKSTAICLDQDTHSIVELAARAAEDCIRESGKEKKRINLMINVGIFRDKNIMEPAMVTLIQQRIGVNLTLEDPRYHTFAFDMLNGSGGMLNAAQAADALLANGDAQCALILGGDVHPSRTKMKNFPYNAVGAAMLLEWSNNPDDGFQSIEMKTCADDYIGSRAFFDINKSGVDSIKTMNFDYEPDYAERLTAFTVKTIQELLEHYRRNHSVQQSNPYKASTCQEHL